MKHNLVTCCLSNFVVFVYCEYYTDKSGVYSVGSEGVEDSEAEEKKGTLIQVEFYIK